MKKRLIIISCTAAALLLLVIAVAIHSFHSTENVLSQNSGSAKVEDVVYSCEPSGVVLASSGEKITFKAKGISGAKFSLRLGSNKHSMSETKLKYGTSEYKVKVKMPKSQIEIETIGKAVIIAVYGGESYSFDSAQIIFSSEKETVSQTKGESVSVEQSSTLKAENFVSTAENQTHPGSAAEFSSTQPSVQYNPFSSAQMCVVTANSADTWPLGDSDAFVPTSTPLVKGTMDYVTGESELYDSEEGEMRYFYSLASGMRVQKKAVSLLNQSSPEDNSISVLSSYCQNGEMHISFSQKWKVPYSFSYAPQQYYSAYKKNYNVSSFTAQTISFTFFHTTSAFGTFDTLGSDAIASASWSVNTAAKTATLTMNLKRAGGYYGHSLSYDANGNLVLTIANKPPQTLSGAVVIVDPGHGGTDSGAVGFGGAVKESQINFATAAYLKNELERRGATVYMTRYDDVKVSLDERKSMIYSVKPDLFISLHSDGSESKTPFGTSAYYFKPMSQALAKNIYDNILSFYGSYMYPSQSDKLASASRGCKFHPFSVTRVEDCPSVLIELGYMTNDEECRKLAESLTQQKLAEAIANGTASYLASLI